MTSVKQPGPQTASEVDLDLRSVKEPHPVARWLGGSGTWVLILDVALVAIFTALSKNHVFWTAPNFRSVALAVSTGLLLALAIGTLLGAGVIDLSVGSNLVLSSVIGAAAMHKVTGPIGPDGSFRNVFLACVVGLLACIAMGGLFGLVNALIIEVLDVNSFIATLGTLGIGTGVALLITQGGDLSGLPTQLQDNFAFVAPLGVPLPALVALAIALASIRGLAWSGELSWVVRVWAGARHD
jgi:ribose transport system permease protein